MRFLFLEHLIKRSVKWWNHFNFDRIQTNFFENFRKNHANPGASAFLRWEQIVLRAMVWQLLERHTWLYYESRRFSIRLHRERDSLVSKFLRNFTASRNACCDFSCLRRALNRYAPTGPLKYLLSRTLPSASKSSYLDSCSMKRKLNGETVLDSILATTSWSWRRWWAVRSTGSSLPQVN